jgi:hypothetical protein
MTSVSTATEADPGSPKKKAIYSGVRFHPLAFAGKIGIMKR